MPPDPVTRRREAERPCHTDCSMEIERWPEMRGPDWRALPWRSRLAWRLRNLANKIDAKLTYAVNGHFHSATTQADLWDALSFGASAAMGYLIDLDRDRKFKGTPDDDA